MACTEFNLDMAAEFNTCTCGFKRNAHSALGSSSRAPVGGGNLKALPKRTTPLAFKAPAAEAAEAEEAEEAAAPMPPKPSRPKHAAARRPPARVAARGRSGSSSSTRKLMQNVVPGMSDDEPSAFSSTESDGDEHADAEAEAEAAEAEAAAAAAAARAAQAKAKAAAAARKRKAKAERAAAEKEAAAVARREAEEEADRIDRDAVALAQAAAAVAAAERGRRAVDAANAKKEKERAKQMDAAHGTMQASAKSLAPAKKIPLWKQRELQRKADAEALKKHTPDKKKVSLFATSESDIDEEDIPSQTFPTSYGHMAALFTGSSEDSPPKPIEVRVPPTVAAAASASVLRDSLSLSPSPDSSEEDGHHKHHEHHHTAKEHAEHKNSLKKLQTQLEKLEQEKVVLERHSANQESEVERLGAEIVRFAEKSEALKATIGGLEVEQLQRQQSSATKSQNSSALESELRRQVSENDALREENAALATRLQSFAMVAEKLADLSEAASSL